MSLYLAVAAGCLVVALHSLKRALAPIGTLLHAAASAAAAALAVVLALALVVMALLTTRV
jgi:hypothetical protein